MVNELIGNAAVVIACNPPGYRQTALYHDFLIYKKLKNSEPDMMILDHFILSAYYHQYHFWGLLS
jgi:hypothetical protein